jgi:TRX_reduct: thioredoxin-disulfide reductase
MQRWKKRCILQNLPEKLRSFTEETSCVQQSLFRRKHLPIRRSHFCGIR